MQIIKTTFFIPCDPVAYQRVRYNSRSRRFFNSNEYTNAKNMIADEASRYVPEGVPNYYPVEIEVLVFLEKPKKPTGKYKACVGIQKGDVDNFLKLIMDAFKNVFYFNDGQVEYGSCRKEYVSEEFPEPGFLIKVTNYFEGEK